MKHPRFVVPGRAGRVNFCFVDPGPVKSGYCLANNHTGKWEIELHGHVDNEELVWLLASAVLPVGRCVFGIEAFGCYGMRKIGAETFLACDWAGQISRAVKTAFDYDPYRPTRPDILEVICGVRSGNKQMATRCLEERFGKRGTKKHPGLFYGMTQHEEDSFAGCLWLEAKADS